MRWTVKKDEAARKEKKSHTKAKKIAKNALTKCKLRVKIDQVERNAGRSRDWLDRAA